MRATKAFGLQLRSARMRAGYTSAEKFARVLGVGPHTYRHWERGDNEPDYDTLARICELLDVTPSDLIVPRNVRERKERSARAVA